VIMWLDFAIASLAVVSGLFFVLAKVFSLLK
jgi:hypothetical protein